MDKTKAGDFFLKKKNFILLFLFSYLFLFLLNYFFPTQSDDMGYTIGGFAAAKRFFLNWNGRLGELFRVSFGGWFATTIAYPFINGLAGTILFFLFFYLIFQRLPSSLKDILCFSIILLFIMVDPVFAFGSLFYWAAGSYNYLYSWIWILLWLRPYIFYWNKNQEIKNEETKIKIILTFLSGFLAGWSSEFCIVFIVLSFISIIFALVKKIKLPFWYYICFISLLTGWIILYTCPGTNKRADSVSGYLSIPDILRLGPKGIFERLVFVYNITKAYLYYENFLLISIFIALTVIAKKITLKNAGFFLISEILMLAALRLLPKLFFIPLAIIICIFYALNQKEFSKYFLLIAGVLIVEFIFIGATIQVTIPKRASFQYTLLNSILIILDVLFFFKLMEKNKKLLRFISISGISCTLLFSVFVLVDAINMNEKWTKMEESIKMQKEAGILNVTIDKNTFISRYWSYGDWGNPTEDVNDWVNVSYSDYYGVKSIVSK